MKKILFAINNLGVGGAENLVIEQINAIKRDKFEPYLLTLYKNPRLNFSEKLFLPPEQYWQLNFKNIFDLAAWLRMYRLMKTAKFDAVITNLFDANLAVRLVAILCRVKIILAYEHSIYENKKFWQKAADYFLSYFTFKILVGSEQVKKFTSRQEKIRPDKFLVNYNSAKLVYVRARSRREEVLKKNNLPLDACYIVTAGRLIKQKGHAYLIEAAARLVKEEKKKILFLIYGQGDLWPELFKQIKENRLENNVFLPGLAPMQDILAISDIFVLPSLWEGLSIALVAAMNAACPIVATRVSGSEEAIDHEVNGLIVWPGDAAALAAALGRLVNNEELGEKLGRAAQEKSYQYSIDNNVKKIEDIININE